MIEKALGGQVGDTSKGLGARYGACGADLDRVEGGGDPLSV